MMLEANSIQGSVDESNSSKIRLPPISFLAQVPSDFSSLKSKEQAGIRPPSHSSNPATVPKTKLQQKQNGGHSDDKNKAKISDAGPINSEKPQEIVNTQISAGQQFHNQPPANGFRQGKNFPYYQTYPPPPQFQSTPQYGFQPQQQVPQQTLQNYGTPGQDPSESLQNQGQRASSATHHHHHHHNGNEQEHRHHHHHHHHHHHQHTQQSHNQPQQSQNQPQQTHNHPQNPLQPVEKSTLNTLSKTGHNSTESKSNVNSKRQRVQTSGVYVTKRVKKLMSALDSKRKHLGTIIYNPTTTWNSLQVTRLQGLDDEERSRLVYLQESSRIRAKEPGMTESYLPVLPPLSESQINNLVEVKIPYKFIKGFQLKYATISNADSLPLWGGQGGIFSDDSDILGALKLSGLFSGTLNLKEWNNSWSSSQIVRPAIVHQDDDGFDLLDLSVTLLLLPGLENYGGIYQNDFYSRCWVGESPHDGLSYAIFNVRWEQFGQVEKGFRKELRKLYQEEEERTQQSQTQGNGWVFKTTEKPVEKSTKN